MADYRMSCTFSVPLSVCYMKCGREMEAWFDSVSITYCMEQIPS